MAEHTPRYVHGQRLSGATLARREAERAEALARHIRSAHGQGIVVGLEALEDEVAPGVGHDAQGHQLVLAAPLPVPEAGAGSRRPARAAALPAGGGPRTGRRLERVAVVREGGSIVLAGDEGSLRIGGGGVRYAGARAAAVAAVSGACTLSLVPGFSIERPGADRADLATGPDGSIAVAGPVETEGKGATAGIALLPVLPPGAARPWSLGAVVSEDGGPPAVRLEIADPGDSGDPAHYAFTVTVAGETALRIEAGGTVRHGGKLQYGERIVRPPADTGDAAVLEALVTAFFEGAATAASFPILFGSVRLPAGVSKADIEVSIVGTDRRALTAPNGTFVIDQAGRPGQMAIVRFERAGIETKTAFGWVGRFMVVDLALAEA
jgi:hypothetical protein